MKITIDNIPPEKVNVIVHLLNDVLSNVSAGSKIEVSEAIADVVGRSEQLKQFEVGDKIEAWGNTFAKVLRVKLTGYVCEDLAGFTFCVDNKDVKDRPL
jgi:hypothetical protein